MIVVSGLSHRTASISIREKIAFGDDEVPGVLARALRQPSVGEAMLISTCNRVELVTVARPQARGDLEPLAVETREVLLERSAQVGRSLYVHEGGDAVRHLFRVASSLDSLVLGEPQILGQVKRAFEVARKAETIGAFLNNTVPRAIRTAKRVRTETTIGQGQVSVPSVAVDLARQIFGDLGGRTVVLVGSGEIGESVAGLLRRSGAELRVVGRNQERVRELAAKIGGDPRRMGDLPVALVEADVVITTTSSPGHVIDRAALARSRKSRRGRSLFLIDLAVPRDVDPRVDSLDGVFLYNIDDFSRVVAESVADREREAARAEAIVEREVAGWDRWAEAMQVTPTIVAMRERFREVLGRELDKSLHGRLKHLAGGDRDALEKMMDAALNKLLHEPTARLRQLGADSEATLAVLADVFALEATERAAESPDSTPAHAGEAGEAEGSSSSEDDPFASEAARQTGTGSR